MYGQWLSFIMKCYSAIFQEKEEMIKLELITFKGVEYNSLQDIPFQENQKIFYKNV